MIITTEHIAIAELVVYIPVELVSLFVVLRHGFHRQLGWIYRYLFVLSSIRIAGGVMEIRSHSDSSNTNDAEWGVLLQFRGTVAITSLKPWPFEKSVSPFGEVPRFYPHYPILIAEIP